MVCSGQTGDFTTGGTGSQTERFFEAARCQQLLIKHDVGSRAVGDDPSLTNDKCPLAQVHDHIQVVGGDDLGMSESLKQLDEGAAGSWIQVG